MMRAIVLVLVACMACGTEPGLPPADGGGDAPADAAGDVAGDRPQSTPECQARRMLDCNGDGTCDTPTGDANCGACGRRCAADQRCDGTGTLCF